MSRKILLVGTLGIALGACSETSDPSGTGGTSGATQGSGGSAPAGTGGASGSAGSGTAASSGSSAGGNGGSAGQAASGGSSGTSTAGAAGQPGAGAGTGGGSAAGGAPTTAGAGGSAPASGGSMPAGGAPGAGNGGRGPAGGSSGSTAAGGGGRAGGDPGTCTASKATGTNAKGSGPHQVVVETNAGAGIKEGTIFRPADLGGDEKYPIFVWGEGGCSQDGLSNATAMAELASHGYFVVADGTPNGSGNRTMDRSNLPGMAAPLVAYIDWAVAENDKPCSAYYQSLDTAKVAANGFSCGGLMSQAMVIDPRIVTWGVNSSGMAGADKAFYDQVHVPVLFVEGGPDDVAYDGGLEGYQAIAKLDVPVLWFSKPLGHGGDLFSAGGGDFTKINLAWLNWWLKGDESATGKGLLVGAGCPYCSGGTWEYQSAHIP